MPLLKKPRTQVPQNLEQNVNTDDFVNSIQNMFLRKMEDVQRHVEEGLKMKDKKISDLEEELRSKDSEITSLKDQIIEYESLKNKVSNFEKRELSIKKLLIQEKKKVMILEHSLKVLKDNSYSDIDLENEISEEMSKEKSKNGITKESLQENTDIVTEENQITDTETENRLNDTEETNYDSDGSDDTQDFNHDPTEDDFSEDEGDKSEDKPDKSKDKEVEQTKSNEAQTKVKMEPVVDDITDTVDEERLLSEPEQEAALDNLDMLLARCENLF